MTFQESVGSCFRQYATFTGRASRSEFWWFWVFTLLVDVAAFIVSATLIGGSVTAVGGADGMSWFVATQGWLPGLVHLALFLPSLAVAIRRLHDVGRSGWWFLILFVPFGFFVLLFWWVQPSERMANRFGPPPA
ncbi:DUF805 domain-containing protein [Xanthobacter tagetidis]|jgi:uncharacterized membrane protein YhaH (DUF805 family)|uniref:DUF805 domain-containing protein n=1 Tax=Xanthobacter tagetidis TaxID=60216 RepID=A0A3L7AHA8_9HYPH|nr:DUF805 domain-containing protein [Xanthobacter tagetidis]MBB6306526.1 uncharacterized membrane protein YhaH (DUF805 family) [Xanthobacter tagetidis]RLP79140.1 DUF805 domain-containing protein [Xanthobacter tagetidis]